MLRILQRRAPGIRILVRGVRVQGIGAEREIADAVAAFGREKAVDVLVVARGGGSLEDLWCFNEEVVARALAASPMPTISAVGHETDFTIADFVADLRAPTPSAAAELLTRDWAEWRETVARCSGGWSAMCATRWCIIGGIWPGSPPATPCASPRRVVREWAQRVDDFRAATGRARRLALCWRDANQLRLLESQLQSHQPRRELARRRAHVEHLAARLRTLGPQATLDRGYALVLDRDGRPLRQADASLVGQPARIALSRGALEATIVRAHPAQGLAETLSPSSTPAVAPAQAKKSKPRRSV